MGSCAQSKNARQKFSLALLFQSISADDTKSFDTYLSHMSDGTRFTSLNSTVMHVCAWFGRAEMLQKVLRAAKYGINDVDFHGDTAAHISAFRKQTECLKVLLEAGASVEVRNNYGESVRDLLKKDESFELGIDELFIGDTDVIEGKRDTEPATDHEQVMLLT